MRDIRGYDVGLRDELVETGERDEDGAFVLVNVTVVLLEASNGRRWLGPSFDDPSEAEAFAKFIKAKGKVDMRFWHETYPRYGSEQYELDEPCLVERERADAERFESEPVRYYRVKSERA